MFDLFELFLRQYTTQMNDTFDNVHYFYTINENKESV